MKGITYTACQSNNNKLLSYPQIKTIISILLDCKKKTHSGMNKYSIVANLSSSLNYINHKKYCLHNDLFTSLKFCKYINVNKC